MASSLWLVPLLALLSTVRGDTCDTKVTECIKTMNSASTVATSKIFVQILRTKDYSVVWHSGPVLEKYNVSCIRTAFTPSKSVDTYWRGCEKIDDISYRSKMDFKTKVLSIDDYYEGISMRAHVVYVGPKCIALYACSPSSDKDAHVKVYCPSNLGEADFSQDLQAARDKLASCDIDDGVSACTDKCP